MSEEIALTLFQKLIAMNSILENEITAAKKGDSRTIISSIGSKISGAEALDDAWHKWLTMCCKTPQICAAIRIVLRQRILEHLVKLHQNLRANCDALQQLVDSGCTDRVVRESLLLVTPIEVYEGEAVLLELRKR